MFYRLYPHFAAADAAAAKSLQSCLTLCEPIDGSPPSSPVPGILQARTLEWVAASFSNAWKWKVKVKSLSYVWLFSTPWTAAHQVPPSMGFSRQEYWSGLPLPTPILTLCVYIYIYIYILYKYVNSSAFVSWIYILHFNWQYDFKIWFLNHKYNMIFLKKLLSSSIKFENLVSVQSYSPFSLIFYDMD